MIFTTTKKKEERVEKYPNIAVLTLLGKTTEDIKFAKVAFQLNKRAMEAFGFPMNTPSVSKIANGYNENNEVVLAAIDTKDGYTSLITAKNTFNSQKLANRLEKAFPGIIEFRLNIVDIDGVKYSTVSPIDLDKEIAMEEVEDALLVEQENIPEPEVEIPEGEGDGEAPKEGVTMQEQAIPELVAEIDEATTVPEIKTPTNSLWD